MNASLQNSFLALPFKRRYKSGVIEKTHIVYLASHLERGEYIGVTTAGLSNRESTHWSAAKANHHGGIHSALRGSLREDWNWTVLHFIRGDEQEAMMVEAQEIAKRKPSLNRRAGGAGGGRWLPGDLRSKFGRKNIGRKASTETKKKLSKFQSSRPRKRGVDRARVKELSLSGKTTVQIAKIMGCSQPHVSRIVSGDYDYRFPKKK